MVTSFRYAVNETASGPELRLFGSQRPKSLTYALGFLGLALLLWSANNSWWGNTYTATLSIVFSLLLVSLASIAYVYSARLRSLSMSPSHLYVRASLWGIQCTRIIPLHKVLAFGFGNFGTQMAPVLRIEIETAPSRRTEWLVLASPVTEGEVAIFLHDVKSRGFRLADAIKRRTYVPR